MEDSNHYAIKVIPEEVLEFTLSRGGGGETSSSNNNPNIIDRESNARCIMTLTHPNTSNSYLAFKVKTTQPRRYLVRPNQGIVAPGQSATVHILLVEKDKQMLLQTYDRLGPSALDHSKDKFLVQSCVVDNDHFAKDYLRQKQQLETVTTDLDKSMTTSKGKELGESLTAMWNALSSSEETQIYNKKLPVKHTVLSWTSTGTTSSSSNHPPYGSLSNNSSIMRSGTTQLSDKTSLEHMTPEQMFMEISSLRRKYDELVTFSVNLTAERDILNNTLEQTKRDLNREISNRGKNMGTGRGGLNSDGSTGRKNGGGISLVQVMIWSILVFLLGVKMTQMNKIGFLMDVPVVRHVLKKEL